MSVSVDVLGNRLRIYQEKKDKNLLSLKFGVYNNTLRIYIHDHSSKDIRDSKFLASIALTTFNARLIVNKMLTLHQETKEYDYKLTLEGMKYVDNKPVEGEKEVKGHIGVGKKNDASGDLINVLYVIDKDNNKYLFGIKPTPYTTITVNDVVVSDKEQLSNEWMLSYSKSLEAMLDIFVEAQEKERPKKGNQEVLF